MKAKVTFFANKIITQYLISAAKAMLHHISQLWIIASLSDFRSFVKVLYIEYDAKPFFDKKMKPSTMFFACTYFS